MTNIINKLHVNVSDFKLTTLVSMGNTANNRCILYCKQSLNWKAFLPSGLNASNYTVLKIVTTGSLFENCAYSTFSVDHA